MMLFRRKHHKLSESVDYIPQRRQCDISCGSDTENSFDPCSYTDDSVAQSPIMVQLHKKTTVAEYPSRIVESKSCRFWKLGWATERAAAKRRKKALAELDKTIMQIRGDNSFEETSPPRSKKNHSGGKSAIEHSVFKNDDGSKVLPREVTWKRRVSSLEAFFKKECKSKYQYSGDSCNESAIMKIVPFETYSGNRGSSYEFHDEIGRPKYSRSKPSKRNSTFEETVERGVSDILGKINSRSEEILDSVPDWSVASSSVDFISTATSDDDDDDATSLSGYRQSPTQRSTSSGDDDEFFLSNGGCNSIESCTTMSKEFETFMDEIMPRDLSMFSCYTISKRKRKRRKKKPL